MNSAREQAARWFTRLLHLPEEHPERAQFETWLRAHPQHQTEYQAFCELWGDFSSTAKTQTLAQSMERRNGRRTFVRNGLLGLVLLIGGGLALRPSTPEELFEQRLTTQLGERKRHTLPDGSELHLGASTRLHVRYDGRQRQVYLLQGEVVFDVAHAADRPFVIDGGLGRITVLGTRFVVNRLDDRLRVSVERGTVRVNGASDSLLLNRNEVAEIRQDQAWQRLALPAAGAFAFERGSLVFEQADLAEIAASLSRYRSQPVRSVPGKESPLITAVVQLSDIDSFLLALPKIAAVNVESHAGVTQLRPR